MLGFREPLFYLIMGKSGDAGNLDAPKRSRKVLPFSEKVKILNLIKKEKKTLLRLVRSRVRNSC